MAPKELILLSPHRFPTDTSPILGSEEIACFMNAWSSLWHPAVLLGAPEPPRVASPYDHENPLDGCIYALPDSPALFLPDDWPQRLTAVGAFSYHANPDRGQTLARQREGMAGAPTNGALWDLPAEKLAPFFALGYGFAVINTLFEAMEHQNVLVVADFWNGVQRAAEAASRGDQAALEEGLRAAADCLRLAREVVYPVEIYWLDFCLIGEKPEERQLPQSLGAKLPLNVLAPADAFESLAKEQPQVIAALREAVEAEKADVCGGLYCEHDDAELRRGQEAYRQIIGRPVNVYARRRFGMHPLTPTLLQAAGIQNAILLAFDDAVLPSYRGTVVNWPAPDGKQVASFTRTPFAADDPATFFHLAAHLRRTIADDHSATLALVHRRQPAVSAYTDLIALSNLGPVLGNWFTISRYLSDVMASEYASSATADDFRGDTLARRVDAHEPVPLSDFAVRARERRRIDVTKTLGALLRGLAGPSDMQSLDLNLPSVEDRTEITGAPDPALEELERSSMAALTNRLTSKATADTPGRMLINPCG